MKRTFLILGFLTLLSVLVFASRPSMPPSRSQVIGLWAGYEVDHPYFYRLNLRNDNTGTMVILLPDGEPSAYSLRWEVKERQLHLKASAVTKESETITCSVEKVNERRMEVVISGVSNEWKRRAFLLNEKVYAEWIEKSDKYEYNATPKGSRTAPERSGEAPR